MCWSCKSRSADDGREEIRTHLYECAARLGVAHKASRLHPFIRTHSARQRFGGDPDGPHVTRSSQRSLPRTSGSRRPPNNRVCAPVILPQKERIYTAKTCRRRTQSVHLLPMQLPSFKPKVNSGDPLANEAVSETSLSSDAKQNPQTPRNLRLPCNEACQDINVLSDPTSSRR